jgi:hypothetical protein
MLRFILIIMIMIVILKVGQDNPYIGFSIYLFLATSFVLYSNNIVVYKDIEFEREMLKTPEGRLRYYQIINSQ